MARKRVERDSRRDPRRGRANYYREMTCPDCGKAFAGYVSRKRCPDCAKAHNAESGREWARRNYGDQKRPQWLRVHITRDWKEPIEFLGRTRSTTRAMQLVVRWAKPRGCRVTGYARFVYVDDRTTIIDFGDYGTFGMLLRD